MKIDEIYEELKKIHSDLKFIGLSNEEPCLIFNDNSVMFLNEFEFNSDTKNLLIKLENKLY